MLNVPVLQEKWKMFELSFSWGKSINWCRVPTRAGTWTGRTGPSWKQTTPTSLNQRAPVLQTDGVSTLNPATSWHLGSGKNRWLLQTFFFFPFFFNPSADIETPHESFSLPSYKATRAAAVRAHISQPVTRRSSNPNLHRDNTCLFRVV